MVIMRTSVVSPTFVEWLSIPMTVNFRRGRAIETAMPLQSTEILSLHQRTIVFAAFELKKAENDLAGQSFAVNRKHELGGHLVQYNRTCTQELQQHL
jgi:hypothetical protein